MDRIDVTIAMDSAASSVVPSRRGGYTVRQSSRVAGSVTGGVWHVADAEAADCECELPGDTARLIVRRCLLGEIGRTHRQPLPVR